MWPTKGGLAFDVYTSFANTLCKHYGPTKAISILKDINSYVRLLTLDRPDVKRVKTFGNMWMKSNRDGLPKDLNGLWIYRHDCPRLVLFITNMVYTLRCKPNTDLSTVESPATTNSWLTWKDSFESFCATQHSEVRVVTEPKRPHFSLKSGPLGPGSIILAGQEVILFNKLGLSSWFQGLCSKAGLDNLGDRFKSFVSFIERRGDQDPTLLLSKRLKEATSVASLVFLANPAGKTRIVYILSWWLQELLVPLHNSAMGWLRQQPQDATFNQSGALKDMVKWTGANAPDIYSFDLSAATDRWPRHHQYIAMKAMFGVDWADIWLEVMEVKPYCAEKKREVCYSVGQPMGAYSSWAALAVTHHMLIRYAAFLIGEVAPQYWVLGDDVLIKGHSLALKYKELISQLGVDISKAKSIAPIKGGNSSSAEFAKHIVVNGTDYTPASPNLVLEVCGQHQWWKLSELLIDFQRHYGLSLIVFNENEVTSSKVLETILSGLSQVQKEKALVALTNPETGFPHLESLEPRTFKDPHNLGLPDCGKIFEGTLVEYFSLAPIPSKWEGLTVDEYLFHKMELVAAANQDALQAQYKLRDGMRSDSVLSSPSESKGLLLNYPQHPLWSVVDGLEEVIRASEYNMAYGDTPSWFNPEEASASLVDSKQVYKWLVLNETKDVTTYNRTAYHKEKRLQIVELWNLFKANRNLSQSIAYDDWT